MAENSKNIKICTGPSYGTALYPQTKVGNVLGDGSTAGLLYMPNGASASVIADSFPTVTISKSAYDALPSASKNGDTIWCITDDSDSSAVYTKNDVDQLIDEVTVKTSTITLSSTWLGSGPYTQTVTVPSGTSNSKIDLQPTAAQLQQLIDDGVTALYIGNNNATFTAYAIGQAPTTSMTIQITRTEVSA